MADQDMITYVAVGKDVEDCKSILSWALENNVGGSRICIIHVHKLAKLFPLEKWNWGLRKRSLCVKLHLSRVKYKSFARAASYLPACQNREASASDTETGQQNLNRSRSGPSGYNNRVGSPVIECSESPKLRSVTVGRNRSTTALAALIAPFPERSKELSSPTSPGDSSYSASSPTRPVEITLNGWNDRNGKALQYSCSLSPPAALDYSRSSSTLDLAPSVVQQSPRLIASSSNISTSSNGAHNVVAQDAENQRDKYIDELWISKEQETSLKSQLAELQKERDELQMERDHALKEAEGLKRKEEDSNGHMLELPEFSLSKIEEATQGFNESQKIGQ
ncbi:hypothetical protein F2P56_026704 [Juglans regia]|uniref:Uncharacterized protein n=1 Tax=Juglans regia TaxID=51240 RepID=A0A833WYM7_JUGRE|nr:hypothetical protein F2P56_026704 [Juglans regia]